MADETKKDETKKDEKPGWKTTEFWLTAAASLVGTLLASGAFPDESGVGKALGVVTVGLATLGYSVSRGVAKK